MNILVTGASGFIGRNLTFWLQDREDIDYTGIDLTSTADELADGIAKADVVIHLAGVNRPVDPAEFRSGNVDFTVELCEGLLAQKRPIPLLLASSTQATLDNHYGVSKREAEEIVVDYSAQSGSSVSIFRLTNVFGKWCRPNYNSVVATFCHQIARNEPISVSDPTRELQLIHVDDVIRGFLAAVSAPEHGATFWKIEPKHPITLGELADLIRSFRAIRTTLQVPDMGDAFVHKLYGTYLSYLEPDAFSYDLTQYSDSRGALAEFIKSPTFGQIFVSRTVPGVIRGNHYHHEKTEKFLVLEGNAIVRFRDIRNGAILEYHVSGGDFKVVDIPPGYTHSIENVGVSELITLFWASEIFDPARPDTKAMPVLLPNAKAAILK